MRHPSAALLATLAVTLLACESAPPPPLPADAPPVEIRLADLAQGKVGLFDLDQVPARKQAWIRHPKPYRNSTVSGGFQLLFDEPSPVAGIRIALRDTNLADYLGSAEVVGTRVELRLPEDGSAAFLTELTEAGLGPVAIAGAYGLDPAPKLGTGLQGYDRRDHDDPATLLCSTPDPRMFLGFRGGELTTVLRETEPNFRTERLPGYATREVLERHVRALAEAGDLPGVKQALPALEQDAPFAAERDALAAPGRTFVAQREAKIWDRIAARAAAWEQRFEAAGTADKFRLLVEQASILADGLDGEGNLADPVERWWQDSRRRVREAMSRDFAPGAGSGSVFVTNMKVNDLWKKPWDYTRGSQGTRDLWERVAVRIHWEVKLQSLVTDDPLETTRAQLALLADNVRRREGFAVTTFQDVERTMDQLSLRLRTAVAEHRLDGWQVRWVIPLAHLLDASSDRQVESMLTRTELVLALRELDRAAAPDDLDAEFARLGRIGTLLERERPLYDAPPEECAATAFDPLTRRATAWPALARDARDRAVVDAVCADLASAQPSAATVRRSHGLLRAARSLDLAGDVEQRIAALTAFANQQPRFGDLAARVAADLSIEAGEQLDAEARTLSARGEFAQAAWLWHRAASIGALEGPSPTTSTMVRLAARRDAQSEALDDSPAAVRARWRTNAQLHALVAVAGMLPRLDDGAAAYPLQTRYLGRQLAGRGRWSELLGLRLQGQGDVATVQRDATPVHLSNPEGAIRWLPNDAGAPVIDLATYRIDTAGWSELRTRKAELDQAQADLDAARRADSTPLPALQADDQRLAAEARAIADAVQNGDKSVQVGRAELEAVQREANALNRAIRNYNDRVNHVNAMVDAYNAKVAEFNALLARLLKEMDVAFRELLEPATTAWLQQQLAAFDGPPRERQLRAVLLGLGSTTEVSGPMPPAHPEALALTVSDLTDPTAAADHLARALAGRLADQTFSKGVSATDHVARLGPAISRYALQYGVEPFVENLLKRALAGHRELHEAIARAVTEPKFREAILGRLK